MQKNPSQKYWIVLADCQLGAIHWQSLTRERDYYTAFQSQCLAAAQDNNCLGILGLGDLRERTTIQAKSLGGMNRGLKLLADAKKPLLALMGNHDKTDPNWIKEMHYPSLKDLTDPKVQEVNGFNPEQTLAIHYTQKSLLIDALKVSNPEKKRTVFLHQSLKEMTTHILQSYDLSIVDLERLGFGKEEKCLFLVGDLHNYGDIQYKNIELAYPGSLEMTDINEGVNGLKSHRLKSSPHDYRKFVIHYFPDTNQWEPVEVEARPWFRGKAKTPKEAKELEVITTSHLKEWTEPGCILLTVPKKEVQNFRTLLKDYPILECRVEQYDPLADFDQEELTTQSLESSLSWKENKKSLLMLAQEKNLNSEALKLLETLCEIDGSSHNVKTDISQAWQTWQTFQPCEPYQPCQLSQPTPLIPPNETPET